MWTERGVKDKLQKAIIDCYRFIDEVDLREFEETYYFGKIDALQSFVEIFDGKNGELDILGKRGRKISQREVEDIKSEEPIILYPKEGNGEPIFVGNGFDGIEDLANEISFIKDGGNGFDVPRESEDKIRKYDEFHVFTPSGLITPKMGKEYNEELKDLFGVEKFDMEDFIESEDDVEEDGSKDEKVGDERIKAKDVVRPISEKTSSRMVVVGESPNSRGNSPNERLLMVMRRAGAGHFYRTSSYVESGLEKEGTVHTIPEQWDELTWEEIGFKQSGGESE